MRHVSHLPWQHILGRLNVLEKLLEAFSSDIIPSQDQESNSSPQPLTAVMQLVLSAVTDSHSKVAKLSKRIFANLCKSIVQFPRIFEDILEMVSRMEPDTARRLERRMQKTMDEYESTRTAEDDETSHADSEMTPPPSPTRVVSSELPLSDKVSRNCVRPRIDMGRVSPSKSKSGKKKHDITQEESEMENLQGATKDESSDVSMASLSPRGEPISFKSEVTTPSVSPQRGPFQSRASNIANCKEQIEIEEAEAIAVAMETSMTQNPLPVVPGLTPQKGTDVIVHVQSEVSNIAGLLLESY